jgi:hypothetical protein
MRYGVDLLQWDADLDAIARHAPLSIVPLTPRASQAAAVNRINVTRDDEHEHRRNRLSPGAVGTGILERPTGGSQLASGSA